MKKNILPPLIFLVLCFSLLYWTYLAGSTNMEISCDAIDYQDTSRMLQQKGFLNFFQTGPHREPVYLCLVAFSMHLETIFNISYTKIMAGLGALILLLTQFLTYNVLKLLNIRTGICALILGYIALSPSLTNTAFSLYSEIAAYPFILGIILVSFQGRKELEQNHIQRSLFLGFVIGLLLVASTLTKAVFECITPLYLGSLLILFCFDQRIRKHAIALLIFFLAATSVYYGAILSYKSLNHKYNGNFAITNRGSWALYGNTVRRMQPLSFQNFLVALSFVPGEGVCNNIFNSEDCNFWSYRKSDELGFHKLGELTAQYPSDPLKVNNTLLQLSLTEIKHNPVQYSLLCIVEAFKMFFWESTKIGFVTYPSWLENLYNTSIFKNVLRFVMALLTIITFTYCWISYYRRQQLLLGPILILISLFLFFHSFFFILTRYILPIAPLYLICIGYSLNLLLPQKKRN